MLEISMRFLRRCLVCRKIRNFFEVCIIKILDDTLIRFRIADDFDLSVFCQYDVFWFDVPMNYSF